MSPKRGASRGEFDQKVGRQIRGLRMKCELSLEDVADLVGVHRNTVSRWEHGGSMDAYSYVTLMRYFDERKWKWRVGRSA